MAKEPFTKAGVEAKLTEIYTLTDSQLMAEAGDVAADFNGWLDDHFLLSSYQTAYLDEVPDMVRKTWGHLFATAFLRRSLITMVNPPDNPPPRRTKEVRKNMAGLLTYNDDTKELDGELSIAITWDLW